MSFATPLFLGGGSSIGSSSSESSTSSCAASSSDSLASEESFSLHSWQYQIGCAIALSKNLFDSSLSMPRQVIASKAQGINVTYLPAIVQKAFLILQMPRLKAWMQAYP